MHYLWIVLQFKHTALLFPFMGIRHLYGQTPVAECRGRGNFSIFMALPLGKCARLWPYWHTKCRRDQSILNTFYDSAIVFAAYQPKYTHDGAYWPYNDICAISDYGNIILSHNIMFFFYSSRIELFLFTYPWWYLNTGHYRTKWLSPLTLPMQARVLWLLDYCLSGYNLKSTETDAYTRVFCSSPNWSVT